MNDRATRQSFNMSPNNAVEINSSFIGLLFITPILTGYLAGVFGFIYITRVLTF